MQSTSLWHKLENFIHERCSRNVARGCERDWDKQEEDRVGRTVGLKRMIERDLLLVWIALIRLNKELTSLSSSKRATPEKLIIGGRKHHPSDRKYTPIRRFNQTCQPNVSIKTAPVEQAITWQIDDDFYDCTKYIRNSQKRRQRKSNGSHSVTKHLHRASLEPADGRVSSSPLKNVHQRSPIHKGLWSCRSFRIHTVVYHHVLLALCPWKFLLLRRGEAKKFNVRLKI